MSSRAAMASVSTRRGFVTLRPTVRTELTKKTAVSDALITPTIRGNKLSSLCVILFVILFFFVFFVRLRTSQRRKKLGA